MDKLTLTTEPVLDDIVILEKCCYSHPWTEEMLASSIESGGMLFIVAIADGKAVGYISALASDVVRMCVLPEYRRSGVASALLTALFEKVDGDIYLEVDANNFPAVRLYEKMGFVNVGVRKGYYENGNDAYVMSRTAKG